MKTCECGSGSEFVFHTYDITGKPAGIKCPHCRPPKNNIIFMDRGEKARPNSGKLASRPKYENEFKQSHYCLIFIEDVRDIQFVHDLLRQGCLSNVTMPNHPVVYDCILKIWSHLSEMENVQRSNMVYNLKSMLFATFGYAHHICGADIEQTQELCDMVRSLDEDHNLRTQVIFIGNQNDGDRYKAFRNAYDLGDVAININDIKSNPMDILKLLPDRQPNEIILQRIIDDAAI